MTNETQAPKRSADLIRYELDSLGQEIKLAGRYVEWLQAVTREFIRLQPAKAPELGALQNKLQVAWSHVKRAVKDNGGAELDNPLIDALREFDAERGAYARELRLLAVQTDTTLIWDVLEERIPMEKRDPNRPLGTLEKSLKTEKKSVPNGYKIPKDLAHPTFIEARQVALSLSDGRDGRNWRPIEGALVLFHRTPEASVSINFDPSKNLLNWWGQSAEIKLMESELENVPLDGVLLFYSALAWAIEKETVSVSIDDLIAAIGRGEDARRSGAARERWREDVWRWLLIFESLVVKGARRGSWREPHNGDTTRAKMGAARLTSEDPLLLIKGRRYLEGEVGNERLVPKEISFTLGAWAEQHRGNREILSELGNVRAIAAIRRGKPSGDWACCAGLMLLQLWRETASKGTPETLKARSSKKTGAAKIETLKTRHFTRRQLLARGLRPESEVQSIFDSPNPRRAKEYWTAAIRELEERGVIGFYQELKPLKAGRENWQEEWLDQPLDIRPAGQIQEDALKINASAKSARKRSTKRPAKTATGDKEAEAPTD